MKLIDKKRSIVSSNKYLFAQLSDKSVPKFILGINDYSDEVMTFFRKNRVRLDGFIDDFTHESSYRDYAITKMCDVSPKDSLIISCVVDGHLLTALDKARSKGLYNILTYLDLLISFPRQIKPLRFCDNNFRDISENRHEYCWLHGVLHDSESKAVLRKILDFRFNFSPGSLRGFKLDPHTQYFDDFITFTKDEVFVDCGGYDGETTLEFIRRNPHYKKIYFIEASIKNYEKARSRLANQSNMVFLNEAVFRTNSVRRFSADLGYHSKIDEHGNHIIHTVKLDDVLTGPVTYIKMDIEGAEYDALMGARETIIRQRPKLAICVYHEQSDFWKIPRLVLSFEKGYNIYLRHYTEGILETVMYFVTKDL